MNAKDLRIGNFINVTRAHGRGNKKTSVKEVNLHYLSQIESNPTIYTPIPLTEKWLLNFGFPLSGILKIKNSDLHIQADYNAGLNEDLFGVYISTDIGFGRSDDPCAHIDGFVFVHQLQNLYFALTGEELVFSDAVL